MRENHKDKGIEKISQNRTCLSKNKTEKEKKKNLYNAEWQGGGLHRRLPALPASLRRFASKPDGASRRDHRSQSGGGEGGLPFLVSSLSTVRSDSAPQDSLQ